MLPPTKKRTSICVWLLGDQHMSWTLWTWSKDTVIIGFAWAWRQSERFLESRTRACHTGLAEVEDSQEKIACCHPPKKSALAYAPSHTFLC